MPRIYLFMEGGVVQDVHYNPFVGGEDPPDVVYIDYDDGGEDPDAVEIDQDDGSIKKAVVGRLEVLPAHRLFRPPSRAIQSVDNLF